MKKCLPIQVAIVLAGCIAAPTPTATATATHTPVASPTPTLTPTATADPNMPAGAIGKDWQGNWIKKTNSRIFTWMEIQNGRTPEVAYRGWYYTGTIDPLGIPLYDRAWWDPEHGRDVLRMKVYLLEPGQPFAALRYLDHSSIEYSTDQAKAGSLSGYVINLAGDRYNMRPGIERWTSFGDFVLAFNGLDNETVPVPVVINFTTADGVTHAWKIGPSYSYTFYEVRWEDADPAVHAEYDELGPMDGISYRHAVTTDTSGNLIVLGAVTHQINSLAPKQLATLVLGQVAEILYYPELPIGNFSNSGPAGNLALYATRDNKTAAHLLIVDK